jgi:putative nucleotidyltransferase with HDIG domain
MNARVDPKLLLRTVNSLPPLPKAALDALAALSDEDASSERCAQLLEADPAMAARTLRLANSAFYGMAGRVGSVRDALHMLGRRTLRSAVTAVIASEQIRVDACAGFDFAAFWRHACGTAIAARAIACELRLDEEAAFTAGLLHDLGRLALAAYFPQQLGETMRAAHAQDLPLHQVEVRLMETDHAELSAAIVAHWHLPQSVVDAVRAHHAPRTAPAAAGACATLADVVHVADAVAHALDLSGAPDEAVPEIDLVTWGRLGLEPAACFAIFKQAEEGVHALGQAFGL